MNKTSPSVARAKGLNADDQPSMPWWIRACKVECGGPTLRDHPLTKEGVGFFTQRRGAALRWARKKGGGEKAAMFGFLGAPGGSVLTLSDQRYTRSRSCSRLRRARVATVRCASGNKGASDREEDVTDELGRRFEEARLQRQAEKEGESATNEDERTTVERLAEFRETEAFEDIKTFSLAFVAALILRTFVIEPRFIPSQSMVPTFDIGDQLLVEKVSKYFRGILPGDIVVFDPPEALILKGYRKSDAFIKRVVANEGDVVEMKNGDLVVNGKARKESYINERASYNWGPQKVPPGMVMVLGDNRNQSYDSHLWGFLPKKNVIGRGAFKYWPLNHARSLFYSE